MGSKNPRLDLRSIKSDKVMDTRGLESPMPLIKTIKALNSLGPEKILEVWCSDPDSKKDIPEIDIKKGAYMGCLQDPDGYMRFFIKKSMVLKGD